MQRKCHGIGVSLQNTTQYQQSGPFIQSQDPRGSIPEEKNGHTHSSQKEGKTTAPGNTFAHALSVHR